LPSQPRKRRILPCFLEDLSVVMKDGILRSTKQTTQGHPACSGEHRPAIYVPEA